MVINYMYNLVDLLQINTVQTKTNPTQPMISTSVSIEKYSLYPQYIPIFPDGSKQNNDTATAIVLNSQNISTQLCLHC